MLSLGRTKRKRLGCLGACALLMLVGCRTAPQTLVQIPAPKARTDIPFIKLEGVIDPDGTPVLLHSSLLDRTAADRESDGVGESDEAMIEYADGETFTFLWKRHPTTGLTELGGPDPFKEGSPYGFRHGMPWSAVLPYFPDGKSLQLVKNHIALKGIGYQASSPTLQPIDAKLFRIASLERICDPTSSLDRANGYPWPARYQIMDIDGVVPSNHQTLMKVEVKGSLPTLGGVLSWRMKGAASWNDILIGRKPEILPTITAERAKSGSKKDWEAEDFEDCNGLPTSRISAPGVQPGVFRIELVFNVPSVFPATYELRLRRSYGLQIFEDDAELIVPSPPPEGSIRDIK